MVSIRVDNLHLTYRTPMRLSFARRDSRVPNQHAGEKVSRVAALNGISFELNAGDRLGLIGRNGAGKTTLLKVLYGIFEPTGGTVDIQGRVDALFNINLGFRPEATGRRNIELRGLINGWTRDEIESRMEWIVKFSGLGHFIDLPFKIYSQGMAARLAFSIATSFDPEILLMDEWIGAGDQDFQGKATRRMNRMARRAGIVVLASHNQALINRTCNKLLELEHGRVKSFRLIEPQPEAGEPAQGGTSQ